MAKARWYQTVARTYKKLTGLYTLVGVVRGVLSAGVMFAVVSKDSVSTPLLNWCDVLGIITGLPTRHPPCPSA